MAINTFLKIFLILYFLMVMLLFSTSTDTQKSLKSIEDTGTLSIFPPRLSSEALSCLAFVLTIHPNASCQCHQWLTCSQSQFLTRFVILEQFTQLATSNTVTNYILHGLINNLIPPLTDLPCQFLLQLMSKFQVSQAPAFHDCLSLQSLCT